MKSQIGIFQEELPSGKIASSYMREASAIALLIFFVYMIFAGISYEFHFLKFIQMRAQNFISEQSFNVLITGQKLFDWDIVAILLIAAFVPKFLQKFAEMKSGGTSSSTISKSESSEIKTNQ